MINSTIRKKNDNSTNEDPKTSFVFEMLLMLPDDLFCKIMKEATECNDFSGKLGKYTFWPDWDVKNIKEINNEKYVEPDLFIQFENFDVIIEAKRSDYGQNKDQWNGQLTAYYHSNSLNGMRREKVVYIAVGGNIGENNDEAYDLKCKRQKCKVYKTSWVELLHCAKDIIGEDDEPQIKRLVELYEKGCNDIFHVRDYKWFDSLLEHEVIRRKFNLSMDDFKGKIDRYAKKIYDLNNK